MSVSGVNFAPFIAANAGLNMSRRRGGGGLPPQEPTPEERERAAYRRGIGHGALAASTGFLVGSALTVLARVVFS